MRQHTWALTRTIRRNLPILLSLFLLLGLWASGPASAAKKLDEIRVDYAYYSLPSLVLKRFGWLEEEFAKDGIRVRWILSLGSNKALEFLASGAVDFGSSAGAAALLSRANGVPIQNVYIYSKPEWAAVVIPKDSKITDLRQLKGKKIAATKGTDPYIFLLRALATVGLGRNDVEIVHLQHPDGKVALERGQVDAWAGLDPHMAQTQLDRGSKLLYRNIDFNTYGFLNIKEEFGKQYPDIVQRVIKAYERARKWILENPEAAAKVYAEEANVSLDVAKIVLIERTRFDNPIPGKEHIEALTAAAEILADAGLVRRGADLDRAIQQLINPTYASAVIKR